MSLRLARLALHQLLPIVHVDIAEQLALARRKVTIHGQDRPRHFDPVDHVQRAGPPQARLAPRDPVDPVLGVADAAV